MAAGKDNLLETDVYNQEPGHAAKHNAVNEQVNWLTDQVADIGSNPDLLASISEQASRTNTLAILGNSLDAMTGLGPDALDPASNSASPARGWFTWANALGGNQISMVYNGGVGGDRVDQYAARLTALLAFDPDFVSVGDAVNDIVQDKTFAQIKTAYTTILDALVGRVVLIRTTTPTAAQINTTGRKTVLSQINDWVRNLPRTRKNVYVIDAWSVIADRTTTACATGMSILGANGGAGTDDLHWSTSGAFRVGQLYAAALAPLLATVPTRGSWDGDPKSVIAKPSFSSGWSKQGGSDTALDVSQSDGKGGKKAVVTITAATTNDERGAVYNEDIDAATRFAVGDVVQATMRFKWSGLTPLAAVQTYCGPQIVIRQRIEGGGFANEFATPPNSSNEMVIPTGLPASGELILSSPRITIISHTPRINLLYLYVEWIGAAGVTFEVTDLAFVKVA